MGNSYTYFWNLPLMVELMAEANGLDIEIYQSTAGGVSLGDHWRGSENLKTRDKIVEGDFDVVILQDHSLRALDQPDSLVHFVKLFADLTERSGAKAMLYETWARQWNPLMQKNISNVYQSAGDQTSSIVVPVGKAWALSLQSNPSFILHSSDNSHPSTLGSYLAACVFYGALTGKSPLSLPARLSKSGEREERIYYMILTQEQAAFCQSVADQVLREAELIQP